MQIYPTDFTFQPGHVSYRQWWYPWQLWARRQVLPLLTSGHRSCLQLQCRRRHQVPGDNTVKTEKRRLHSSSWRVSSFKSSAAAPSWERSAMPEMSRWSILIIFEITCRLDDEPPSYVGLVDQTESARSNLQRWNRLCKTRIARSREGTLGSNSFRPATIWTVLWQHSKLYNQNNDLYIMTTFVLVRHN